jgi:hypothetical protein
LFTHQVSLVDEDAVCIADLLHRLVHHSLLLLGVQVADHVLGIHHCHHTIQADPAQQNAVRW